MFNRKIGTISRTMHRPYEGMVGGDSGGLKRLEYIEGTGTQYIDTGIQLGRNDIVECEFKSTSNTSGGLYGVYKSNEYTTFYADGTYYGFDVSNGIKMDTGVSIDTNWHTVEHNLIACTITFDGETISRTPTRFMASANSPLFARVSDGEVGYFFIGCVKSFKIKRSGNVILDYKPCKYNGEIGMYDTVSETFVGNSGSGEFK